MWELHPFLFTNLFHKMKIFSLALAPASNFDFDEFHARLCKSVFCKELSTKTTKLEIKMRLDSRMEKIEMQMGRSALGRRRALRPLTEILNNYKLLFISSVVYFIFRHGLDGQGGVGSQTYFDKEVREEIAGNEKLQSTKHEIFKPSTRPEPKALDVEIFPEHNVIEEDIT